MEVALVRSGQIDSNIMVAPEMMEWRRKKDSRRLIQPVNNLACNRLMLWEKSADAVRGTHVSV